MSDLEEEEAEDGLDVDKTMTTTHKTNTTQAYDMNFDDSNEQERVITKDVKQELYGWGRAYHGQLGLQKDVLV